MITDSQREHGKGADNGRIVTEHTGELRAPLLVAVPPKRYPPSSGGDPRPSVFPSVKTPFGPESIAENAEAADTYRIRTDSFPRAESSGSGVISVLAVAVCDAEKSSPRRAGRESTSTEWTSLMLRMR